MIEVKAEDGSVEAPTEGGRASRVVFGIEAIACLGTTVDAGEDPAIGSPNCSTVADHQHWRLY